MTNELIYSVLQYKHSLVLGESLNVGILFSFPDENKICFIAGNTQRVKAIYPDFDISIFNSIINNISKKTTAAARQTGNELIEGLIIGESFYKGKSKDSLKEYLNSYILNEDSTVLQFSEVYTAVNRFESTDKAVEEFAKILIPNPVDKKDTLARRNESYINKRFIESLKSRNINPDIRIGKNREITEKGISLTFDFSWKNHSTHLVKSLSFDLKEGSLIQTKSVTCFGYLDLLSEYAKRNDCTFDLLVTKPQDEALQRSYENAIEILESSKAPKSIIPEDALESYSDQAAEALHQKDL